MSASRKESRQTADMTFCVIYRVVNLIRQRYDVQLKLVVDEISALYTYLFQL